MSHRRIIGIMNKYYFRSKIYLDKVEVRDIKINIVLGKKVKPIEIFVGVSINSKEYYERKEVFDYFYKEDKTDLEIQNIWLEIQKERVLRRQIYK